jgi:pimeloyl-ACP methyl ester carboxylesterase
MECANFDDGVYLEYIIKGRRETEPVILIHGSVIADANAPLLAQPVLMNHYYMISYHRRGFAGSSKYADNDVISISKQALECQKLMHYLDIKSAHIVGHSHGGVIALQLALDFPNNVSSLSLLEPALIGYIPNSQKYIQEHIPIIQMYEKGDKAQAIDSFLNLVGGARCHNLVDKILPGAIYQAIVDADSLFKIDMPAMQLWKITQKEISTLNYNNHNNYNKSKPILSVHGLDSMPMFAEMHELVLKWFPQAEASVLPKATHWLQLANPKGLAERLDAFFAMHSISQ